MRKPKLDIIDRKILDYLTQNNRTPYTEIAKNLNISAGTIHLRVKKMEDAGIIKGSSLIIDYTKLGYAFIFYITISVKRMSIIRDVLNELKNISNITVANLVTGSPSIFCKIRTKNAEHAKNIIFKVSELKGVKGTKTFISLEEYINDKSRLMNSIFNDLK